MSGERETMSAADCKAKGNEFLKTKDFDMAISWYTTAIEKDNTQHVFYSNRSAAYLQKGDADSALKDAESCIAAKPDWAKGYNRKGCAQHALKQYDEAIATFEAGLKIAPGSALLTGPMKEAQTAQKNAAAAASAGGKTQMPNVFGPDMWAKLQSNPQTAEWLQDPAYVNGLNAIAANPQMMQNPQMIQSLGDQRLLQTFLFLMGMPLNLGQEGGPGYSGPPREDQKVYKKKEPEPEPVKELTEEEKALAAIREKGTALKDQGNALFKEKKYKEAIEMYLKAEEADPTLMTYRTNVASCYHAMKEYATAVEECKKALEIGAEHYNDYKLKAKAMERIGNAYWKLEDFDAALEWQDKAQMEIHDDKRYAKIKKWRKLLSKKKAEAYLDPVKALEAKEAGNKCFSAKDFKGAIELYTEAIKRDPTNPAYFCNRCGALQKVMDLEGAKKDANKAIELDPTYVKAYSRRATCEYFTKEYHKCLTSYQKILEIEPDNKDAMSGMNRVARIIEGNNASGNVDPQQRARAMADPEIKAILEDPYIQTALREMQTDPGAFQGYMKQPDVAAKINKLIHSGILQVGSGPRK